MNDFKVRDRVLFKGKNGFVRKVGEQLDIIIDDNKKEFVYYPTKHGPEKLDINSVLIFREKNLEYYYPLEPDPAFKGFHIGDKVVDTSDSNEKGEILEFKYYANFAHAFVRYGESLEMLTDINNLELDKGENEMEQDDFTGPEFKGFRVGDRVNILGSYGTYTISELKYVDFLPVAIFRNIAGDKNDLTLPISSLGFIEPR